MSSNPVTVSTHPDKATCGSLEGGCAVAQPDYSDGSMLARYPPSSLARKLAIPGGLAPDDLHLTVAYTGDAVDTDRKQLRKAAKTLAHRGPMSATISGQAWFTSGLRQLLARDDARRGHHVAAVAIPPGLGRVAVWRASGQPAASPSRPSSTALRAMRLPLKQRCPRRERQTMCRRAAPPHMMGMAARRAAS